MASGVNVKMGVTGVAQFKKNIDTAKQSLKTLDAQLALNEKQFKATGDSEAYLQEKSELLRVKLDEQKAVAANAEKALNDMARNGVDKASKAYQDMQRQLLEAKSGILDSEAALNGVAEAGEEAGNGVDAMNQQLKRVGDGVTFQNVTTAIDGITGKMEAAARAAIKMGRKIIEATLSKGQWADELAAEASQFGISTDELQRMRKTETLIDTSVEAIISAKKRLRKERAGESKDTMGAFAALGIDPKDAKDADDLFWKTGESLMKLGDEYKQEAYAQKLFGRSWNELIPLFTAGREEYEKTNAGWNTLSEEQLDGLTKMDDQYQKLNIAWQDFQTQILSAFSGPLTEGMEAITGLFEELNKYLQSEQGKEMLKQMGDTVSGLIQDLVNIDPAEVVAGLKSVIDGITDALKWIDEHHEDVVIAMGAIVAGWAGLKVTGGVLKVLELIKGLQWLKGTPSINIPNTTGGAGTGASAAGSAAGTGAGAAAKGGIRTAVSTAGKIAPFALPFALGVDHMIHMAQVFDEMEKKGEEAAKHAEEMTAGRSDSPFFGEWDALYSYLVGTDRAGGKEKMDRLNRDFMNWWENDDNSSMIDELVELMPEELLDKFVESMLAYNRGDQFYSEEDRNAFTDPLNETLSILEERMASETDDLTGSTNAQKESNKEMTEAANSLKTVPTETAEAVRRELNGMQVVFDGGGLTQVVGQLMARNVMQ